MAWYHNIALALALAVLAAPPLAGQPPTGLTPQTLQPENVDNLQLQDAAWVVAINELRRQGALGGKLYGTAGGDPAMNGLYTYLAFSISAGDGWQIFRIGDFLSYRIVSEAPGRVLLQVRESMMNTDGEIGTRTRRIALGWTPGPEGAPPDLVSMTPAR